jgi:hypothetical protein
MARHAVPSEAIRRLVAKALTPPALKDFHRPHRRSVSPCFLPDGPGVLDIILAQAVMMPSNISMAEALPTVSPAKAAA